MITDPPPEKLVGALVSGLRVLRYLSAAKEGVGVTRIARDLEINSSTCYNILKTLLYERLISFNELNKTYAIALGLVEMAKGVLEHESHVRLIHPYLQRISTEHDVTSTLWQRASDERVVLVDRAESSGSVRVHMSIGQRLPMYIAALGRCMAAHSGLSVADLKQRFDALRWDDKPPFSDYLADIEQAQEQGYAVDLGHYVKGVSTVSAPILDSTGAAIMAISAVGFSAQLNDITIKRLGECLCNNAKEISAALSGQCFPK